MEPRAFQLCLCIFLFFLVFPLTSHAIRSEPMATKPSPFEFLKHFQGSHMGEKVEGLHKLKTYLEHFGYLNYLQNQAHANNDDFDGSLESAIKTYQLNYHLKPTGTLDAQTVSQMMAPRCGVPDIINGTNKMQEGEKMSHQAIHTVSHYSFFPGYPRWPPSKFQLTYGFIPGTPQDAISAVARAFNKWASATPFRFFQVANFQTADLKIGFFRRDHGDGYPFDGSGGILAHAFAPTDGRFHFDGDERWSVGAVPNAFDYETVAVHEIGHLLGLDHSSVPNAIMYPTINPGSTKGLNADDIQGIRALYGF